MSTASATVLVLGVLGLAAGTYLLRLGGIVLRGRRTLTPAAERTLDVAVAVVFVALVATSAFPAGVTASGFALPAGVLVAAVLAWRRAPFVVVVVGAAAVTALLRLLGAA